MRNCAGVFVTVGDAAPEFTDSGGTVMSSEKEPSSLQKDPVESCRTSGGLAGTAAEVVVGPAGGATSWDASSVVGAAVGEAIKKITIVD